MFYLELLELYNDKLKIRTSKNDDGVVLAPLPTICVFLKMISLLTPEMTLPVTEKVFYDFTNVQKSLVIRWKHEFQSGCYKKTKHVMFSEKLTFLTLLLRTRALMSSPDSRNIYWNLDSSFFNPFMNDIEKWPNILLKTYSKNFGNSVEYLGSGMH